MSIEKPYIPSPAEENDAIDSMTPQQGKDSSKRVEQLERQTINTNEALFPLDDIADSLNEMDRKIHEKEQEAIANGLNSPDMIRDIREAKRIGSDIRRGLNELNALKFGKVDKPAY